MAYLEYTLTPAVLELIHTEVPEPLRLQGIAAALAETGLRYAREHHLKVDIICPLVSEYVSRHPEYNNLIMR